MTLVNKAAEARDRNSLEQGEIDEVWCVFDVEWPRNHPNLRQATEKAKARNVNLAISNPCFELWLVLHFEARTAWLDSDTAGKLRCHHDKSSGKGLEGSEYMPRRTVAANRARALAAKHTGDGTEFPVWVPESVTGFFRKFWRVSGSDFGGRLRVHRWFESFEIQSASDVGENLLGVSAESSMAEEEVRGIASVGLRM